MRMTRRVLFWAVLLGACLPVFGAASVWAADPPAAGGKIGVVNLNRLFKEFEETKSTQARLEKLSQQKQAEREKLVEEIRGLRDELALLNDENRRKQREVIDEKFKKLAQFDQDARDQLRGEGEQALDKLRKEIERIVTGYAKQNGYDLILTDQATLFFADGIDITNEILALLNQQARKSP